MSHRLVEDSASSQVQDAMKLIPSWTEMSAIEIYVSHTIDVLGSFGQLSQSCVDWGQEASFRP